MRGLRVLGIWALLIPGAVAIQPAFGGWQGFIPGLAGITVGSLVGYLTSRWKLSLLPTFLSGLAAYFLIGGIAALPRTTVWGFLPSADTLRRLVLLLVQSWRDLLTVATPAGDFTGPAVVPWLTGLVAGLVAATVVMRTSVVFWPLIVPPSLLVISIGFGVREAPTAVWLGAALAMGMVVWVWVHQVVAQRSDNADILVNQQADLSQLLRQGIAATLVVALAGTGAVAATWWTSPLVNRQVLRDGIEPPLDLSQFPSPLMKYRLYEVEQKDTTLFTVTGMPEGTRLRLAVMDTYDGNVFNVSQRASHYLRTGRSLVPGIDANAELAVTVGEYSGVWVPVAGQPRWLDFQGQRALTLAEHTYYNRNAKQVLTTAGLTVGDSYVVEAAVTPELSPDERAELGAMTPGSEPLAQLEGVPEVLSSFASDYAAGQPTAFDQLVAIEAALQEGWYSDGSDNKSLSGHTTERLSAMFRASALVGDDEQYAAAMAIMANQLGIPARVVMGFYTEDHSYPGETWEVKGTQAHVWVEAHFADVGWVAFNPTPDRDRKLETQIPQPKPKPKPQVDPPPNPPEKLPEEPVIPDQEAADRKGDDQWQFPWAIVLWILGVAGSLFLLALPFLAILAVKARRLRRRRTTGASHQRLAGAWDEVVDCARDLGYRAATSNTRAEAAQRLQQAYPEVPITPVAQQIDYAMFAPTPPSLEVAEHAWVASDKVRDALTSRLPWYRRLLAALSLRSLTRAKLMAPEKTEGSQPNSDITAVGESKEGHD